MVQNSPVQIIAFQKQCFMLFIGHCLQHQWTVQGENVLIRYELNWEWHGWVLILVLPQAFPFLFCVYSHASRYRACYPFTEFHSSTVNKRDRFPSFFLNGDATSDARLLQMQSRRAGLCLAPSTSSPLLQMWPFFDGISVCRNLQSWWLQCLMEFNLAFAFLGNGLVTRSWHRFLWVPASGHLYFFHISPECAWEKK